MRADKIVIGESYRHKDHPTYCWAKVLEVLPKNTGSTPFNRIIVKCLYSVGKDASFGIVKHFKPSDLVVGA